MDAYRSGVGVIRADEAKAVEYYTRATNQCVAEAWSEIGELYEKGTGGASKMTIYQISYDKKSKQMFLTGISMESNPKIEARMSIEVCMSSKRPM